MNRKDINLLKSLYKISSPSRQEGAMIDFLVKMFEKKGYLIEGDKLQNLYITKGKAETYPCIVAHLDEVHHSKGEGFRVVRIDNLLFGYDVDAMGAAGIGADDKNGIFCAIKMLEEFPAVKAAFFIGEEIGCIGSNNADMTFFDDCRFVVQCDRKGNSDFISSTWSEVLCSKEFVRDCKIKDFGYAEATGMMTDVEALKSNGLEISCCNLSCGYYNAHSFNETTNIYDLSKCLKLVRHIFSLHKIYKHKRKDYLFVNRRYKNYSTSKYGGMADHDDYVNELNGYGYRNYNPITPIKPNDLTNEEVALVEDWIIDNYDAHTPAWDMYGYAKADTIIGSIVLKMGYDRFREKLNIIF